MTDHVTPEDGYALAAEIEEYGSGGQVYETWADEVRSLTSRVEELTEQNAILRAGYDNYNAERKEAWRQVEQMRAVVEAARKLLSVLDEFIGHWPTGTAAEADELENALAALDASRSET